MPWLIIIFGIFLIIVNIKAINRDKNSFQSMIKYKEEDIQDVNIEIGQLRKDFAETILELQKEILEIKAMVEKSDSDQKIEFEETIKQDETINIDKTIPQNEAVINQINVASKTDRIKELIDAGLSDEEICEKLSLGKGEILLVKGLYR